MPIARMISVISNSKMVKPVASRARRSMSARLLLDVGPAGQVGLDAAHQVDLAVLVLGRDGELDGGRAGDAAGRGEYDGGGRHGDRHAPERVLLVDDAVDGRRVGVVAVVVAV